MPIYEYTCDACGHELEEMQKFNDKPLVICPECREDKLQRKFSLSAFHLKGGGWYKDGYSGDTSSRSSKSSGAKGGSKGKSDGASKDKSSKAGSSSEKSKAA